jgi:hypothetical protein
VTTGSGTGRGSAPSGDAAKAHRAERAEGGVGARGKIPDGSGHDDIPIRGLSQGSRGGRDAAVRLAGQAAAADVEVTLEITPGVPHVFQAYSAILDEGAAALDRAGRFLSAQLVVDFGARIA